MTQKKFAQICKAEVEDYLKQASSQLNAGNFKTEVEKPVFLFPTHLLVGLVEGYLSFELAGASTEYRPLEVKYSRPKSINGFLGQLNDRGAGGIVINSGTNNIQFIRLRLEVGVSDEELLRRYPKIAEQYKSTILFNFDCNKIFSLEKGFDFFIVEDVLMSNIFGKNVRIRNPLLLMLISNKTTAEKLKIYLKKEFSIQDNTQIRIIKTVPDGMSVKTQLRSQFYNLYLQEGIKETTLGDFLNTHKEILLKALGGQDLIYEPTLEWKTDIGQDEVSINPDFMIKRLDGYYDIYDLKLPLLSRASLTKGNFSRRRFIEPVDEGRAQLANYSDYFRYEENIRHAEKKYAIKVKNPAMTLIVGNYENYDNNLIKQAGRDISNFNILDYDTILNLYYINTSQ